MRLNNKNKNFIYQFYFTLATVILVIGLGFTFFHFINLPILNKKWGYFFIFLGGSLHIILLLKGRQIFEYDSDGEALNFKNYSTTPMLKQEAKDEFPKYKLISYEVINAILFKRLYIKISSRKKNETILKYDISYLKLKEIRDLKSSLNRIIKNNKENNQYYETK